MAEADVKLAVMDTKLKGHDARITSLHGRVGESQVMLSNQKAQLGVIGREVEELREDQNDFKKEVKETLAEMRTEFKESQQKMTEDFNEKFAALTTTAKWGTGTMIAALGVLLTLLAKGGV